MLHSITLRWSLGLLLVAGLVACGAPDPAGPDAPVADAPAADAPAADAVPDGDAGPDLGCLGRAPPTTAPDPIAVAASVFVADQLALAPAAAAAVELRRRGDGALLASATTDAEGRVALSVASGGVPVEAYLVATAAGALPTHGFPPPLVGGEHLFAVVAGAAEVASWYAQVGDRLDPGDGTVVAVADDCAGDTLAGATVTATPPPATLTYYRPSPPGWDPTLTATVNGYALLTGAAASVELAASYHSAALPVRTIPVSPRVLTMTVLRP